MGIIKQIQFKAKNGDDILLRSPCEDDAESILLLVKEILQTSQHLATEPEEFKYTVEEEREMLRSYRENPGKVWIVAELKGELIGVLNFSAGGRMREAHQGAFGISLRESHRGLGIGRALISALLEWARANKSIECVRLMVNSKNTEGRALYGKLGFQEEGRTIRGTKFKDGTYDDVIAMALHL